MQEATVKTETHTVSLSSIVEALVKNHIDAVGRKNVTGIYDLVLDEVEEILLQLTMEHSRYNQCRAAECLGISRGTLRTKLKKYFGAKYFRQRDSE